MQTALAQLAVLVSSIQTLAEDDVVVTPVELLLLEDVHGTLGNVIETLRQRTSDSVRAESGPVPGPTATDGDRPWTGRHEEPAGD